MAAKPGRRVIGAPQDGVKVSISDDVLEEIAIIEVTHTEGVAPAPAGDGQGMFRRHGPVAVSQEVHGQEVVFHVKFSVCGGARIPEVATEVRRRIASAVREKTGFVVRAVHVLVDRVVFGEQSRAEGS